VREGARGLVGRRRHRAGTDGLAPGAKQFFGKAMAPMTEELFDFHFGFREFILSDD
jgi:hypothetical protein